MENGSEERVLIENVIAPEFIRALQEAGLYTSFMRYLAYGTDAESPALPKSWNKFMFAVSPHGWVWSAFVWAESPEGNTKWKLFAIHWMGVLDEIM